MFRVLGIPDGSSLDLESCEWLFRGFLGSCRVVSKDSKRGF